MSRLQQSLAEIAAARSPSGSLFRFATANGANERSASAGELVTEARQVSAALQRRLTPQARVIIAMPHGFDLLSSLLSCFDASAVAVPVVLAAGEPTPSELDRILALQARFGASGDAVILTADDRLATALAARPGGLRRLLRLDELRRDGGPQAGSRAIGEDEGALLLLTSGSTGEPKGILLSHGNVWHQARGGAEQWAMTDASRIVSWLSPSHNFGLHFGVLAPLLCGAESTFLAPAELMKRPAIWFELVKRVGATHVAAPNFAFDLWTDSVTAADIPAEALTTVTHMVSGGEPVRQRSVERFLAKFGRAGARARAFCAHYGLSETGGLATWNAGCGPQFATLDAGVCVANCGSPSADVTLRIVDPDRGVSCGEGEVGEVWVKGPGVAAGYLDGGGIDRQLFGCTIVDRGETGFFRTGDRGFLRDGCVYIVGRDKEVIIIRGRNHFPAHLESTIAAVPADGVLKPVVFGLERGDREIVAALIGVAEPLPATSCAALAAGIRRQVAEVHGVTVDELAFVEAQRLLPASPGKLNRRPIKEAYVAGKLPTLWLEAASAGRAGGDAAAEDQTIATVRRIFADTLGERDRQPGIDTAFSEVGLDSLQCMRLAGEIERAFGVPFDATQFFKHQTIGEIAAHLQGRGDPAGHGPRHAARPSNGVAVEQIAVVGMHCELPGAGEGTEALWKFLLAGGDGIGLIERQRPELWQAMRVYAPGIDERALPRSAGLLQDVDRFDAPFFGISRREAECMDPQQRKVLELIWKLAEASGRDPSSWSGQPVGLFVAAHTADYGEILAARPDVMVHSGAYIDSGTHHAMIPNRASRWFNFTGPSEVINTACSSSLVAVHRAVEALRRGECSSAIVVGVNLILTPRVLLSSAAAGMLAPDGRCKTLDAAADGFVRSEGLAGVLMKPLGRALADGDEILGVIRGVAVNHDGRSSSLRAPNVNAQKRLLVAAYSDAGIDPASVGYVELHGTGTNLGDPIEVHALKEAFAALSPGMPPGRCGIGSIKSNIGHAESAAGLAGLIKVLLAFRHGRLPATQHFTRLNPRIDLHDSPFRVIAQAEPWRSHDVALPLRAGVSSFGFGGVNAHVVLEQHLSSATVAIDARDRGGAAPVLIVLSARSEERLRAQVRQLLEWLRQTEPRPELAAVAHALQVGRKAMEHRLGVAATSAAEVEGKLQAFLDGEARIEGLCYGQVGLDPQTTATRIELLDAWVRGASVDWRKLYGDAAPPRVSLPTYAFARERYWVPDPPAAPRAPQRFTSRFSGAEFFLADHRIHGQRVLPAVMQLEMARAAIERAATTRSPDSWLRLENVVFVRPVVVADGGLQAHVTLEPEDDGAIAFTIESGEDEATVVHSRGRARHLPAATRRRVDLARLQELSAERVASGDACYQHFARTGLVLGARLRSMRQVRLAHDADSGRPVALAELALPHELALEAGEYALHPSLLDGALQSTVGLLLGLHGLEDGKMTLPFALQRLDVPTPLPETAWAIVRYAEGSGPERPAPKLDIDVCDNAGWVCASLSGLSSRSPILDAKQAAAERADELTLAPVWRPRPSSDGGTQSPGAAEPVVVIGDGESLRGLLGIYAHSTLLEPNGQHSVEELARRLGRLGGFAHVFWAVPDEEAELFSTAILDAQQRGVLFGFRLVKALLSLGYGGRPLGLTILTRQTQSVDATDAPPRPTHAGVHGLVGALAKEYPSWSVRLIDLPEREPWPRWEQVLAQPAHPRGTTVAYRGGRWLAPQLARVRLPEPAQPVYRRGGTYVIVGGAGGLGEVFSEHLIRTCGARVVWIGRRARDAEIERKLARLAELGPAPHYIAADARSAAAMQAARAEVIERFGRVHGVVLATVVLQDRSLARMEEEGFRASLEAKLDVSVQVARAFREDALDLVVFFSSLQSMSKAAGQSNYAAGCVFADTFAQAWAHGGAPVKIVNWGYWGSAGVVASRAYRERMARIGLASIETPEAMAALERLLATPAQQIVFVKTAGAAANLLAEIAVEEPLDPVLARLLFAQLRELGLFAEPVVATWKRTVAWPAQYDRWLEHSVALLHAHGYLDGGTPSQQAASLPPLARLWSEWEEHKQRGVRDDQQRAQVGALDVCLRALPDILRGRRKATEVLFPNGSMELVEGVYKGNATADHFNDLVAEKLIAQIEHKLAADPAARLRLLEIGAGTGGTTARLLERLRPFEASIARYLYTDVSKAFLLHAERHYRPRARYLETALFDVEHAPASQGLAAGGYDIVIATNVLHATRDIRAAVRNARALLGRGGLLLLNEITGSNLFTHLTFGLLEGWWRYQDAELRVPGSPALAPASWRAVLEGEGFRVTEDPAASADASPQQVIVAQLGGATTTHARAPESLRPRAASRFKQLIAKILKIDEREIDSSTTIDRYGIDSIVVVELSNLLSTVLGEIDATLFFESPSIDAMVDHFIATRPAELMRWVGLEAPAPPQNLQVEAERHFKELIGKILKIDPSQIDTQKSLDQYGIDSIVVVELTGDLRKVFGEVDSSLLFESQSVAALAQYFASTHPEALARWVGVSESVPRAPAGVAPQPPAPQPVAAQPEPRPVAAQPQWGSPAGAGDVAIIGISGRYPGAGAVDEFWDKLKGGVNCITAVPAERWDHGRYFDAEKGKPGKTYSRFGGFIDGVDRFDAAFFDIDPAEAAQMDPQERLFLQEVYRSIEDAGYTPAGLCASKRVGVFVGVMNAYHLGGARHWSIANRVSYSFDFRGPSMAVDSACSSALTTVHLAVESLRSETSEVAIAGGVNLIVAPEQYVELSSLGMLASGAECRPFGDGADGFVDGEGCGALLLKPLRQAIADGDHIHAVIKGTMVNAGGRSMGYTAPSPSALADVIGGALERAGVEPRTVSYVEAHGTGTLLGDAVEVSALNRVFQAHTQDTQFCALGSVKSNIGHCESASGMAGITKVVLQMRHGQLAPTLHCATLNPHIDFGKSAFTVQRELTAWPRPVLQRDGEAKQYPRRAGVSSFGAGGANAHVVLEEYVPGAPPQARTSAQGPALIVLSAKTEEALRQRVRGLLDWMVQRKPTAFDLANVAYTLQIGREAMEVRLAAIAGSWEAAAAKLRSYLDGGRWIDALYAGDVASSKDAIALLAADEDMADAIAAWMAKGKYAKLLELWVKGLAIDWNGLYRGARPQRVSLPTYPFAQQPTEPAPRQRSSGPRTEVERKLATMWEALLDRGAVGPRNSFFDLGGNSLLATQLLARVRAVFEVELPVAALFESYTLEAMASRIERVLAEGGGARPAAIAAVARDGAIPLAYAQERVWFVYEHMADQRTSYNITSALHFHGKRFSLERLRAAFEGLVARHETLRTQFQVVEGGVEPQQVIGPPRTVEIARVEVSEAEVTAAVNELSRQAFDLEQGPLVKVCVLRVADDRHIVVLNIHHIIADGWSFGVLINELQRLYDGDVRLEPLVVQYAEYAVWQRRQDLSAQLAYWKRRLDGYEDGMDLPYDQPRRAGRAWRAATLQCRYPAELARKVAAFSREQHATLFMSLVASLAVVLSRYTNRRDLCIGTTVAGRDQIELEKLIGFFINILPLRIEVPGEVSLKEVVQRTKQVVLEGFEHQALPFEHLLKELRKPRDTSQIPLVPVMVRHQNFPIAQVESWAEGVALEKFELCGERTTPSEMDWQFFGDGTTLELTLEYAADLFAEDTVRRMVAHHQRVLEALVERPDERVDAVDVLTAEEQQLYARMNDTASSTDTWRSLAERFEAQVEATPEAVACISVVEHGDARRLTYRELNARANAVARRLRAMGVRAETRVAVICERSQELLVAMLATFKAGGCYVPIDPQYPKQYIEEILADAAPEVVLGMGGLEIGDQVEVENPPAVRIEPASLACLMYTSGSTGRPKGVMVPYAQIDNWLQASWRRYPFAAGEVMLQKTSIAFAVSVKELLTGLLAGVAQVMLPDAMVKDSAALAAASERWAVTRMHLVPSHLRALLETVGERTSMLRSLRYIVTAGEALPRAVRDEVRQKLPQVALWNNYGCTELNDTTYFAATAADGPDTAFVPIGQPIANTHVYALDEQLRRVPIGVIGELHVDSVGMARGYWGQPDLTAERFIPNPYSRRPGARLYRTGDMVRVLGDGTLEYIGRRDYEIKVRGHRVDVRQVEAVANAHPAIRQAVVAGWPPGSSAAQLAAYLVPHSAVDIEQIRRYLAEHLPTYMVPTLYTVVKALPRLPNGKLDRQALPAPDVTGSREEYVAPRNAIEQQLADIFGDVLGVTQVGIHDNFFHLGGHSLLASRVASQIGKQLDVRLSIATLFQRPTIGGLAECIRAEPSDSAPAPEIVRSSDADAPTVLSFAQERMWFLHKFVKGVPYNTPGLALLTGELDVDALRRAVVTVIQRHEPLRTNFVETDGRLFQIVGSADRFELPVVPIADERELDQMLQVELHRPFDLERDLLIRAHLYRRDAQHHHMAVTIHHIAFDGWSLAIFFRELAACYTAYREGRQSALPDLPVAYRDHARSERAVLDDDALRDQLRYWREQLSGAELLVLPTTYPRPPFHSFAGAIEPLEIDAALTERLKALCAASGATLYMVLLGALTVLLARYSGQDDLCVGSPVANRSRVEIQDLIGLFVNTLVMRVNAAGNPRFIDLLRRVHQTALDAYRHQEVPFEKIVEQLQVARDTARAPLVQVMLNFQNMPAAELELPGLILTPATIHNGTAKFELTVDVTQTSAGLAGFVEYASDLFSAAFVERLVGHLKVLLEAICHAPETPIHELPLLTPDERRELEARPAEAPAEALACLHRLFEQRAREHAHEPALLHGGEQLTHAALDERASRIASHLLQQGVGPGTLVGLCVERSLDLVSGVLGILKAGGAFVPMDPASSPEELYAVLYESRVGVILTQSHLVRSIPADARDQKMVLIDADVLGRPAGAGVVVEAKAEAEQPAYVTFSAEAGSIGRGVTVTHAGVVGRLAHCQRRYFAGALHRFLLAAPITLDRCVAELFQWIVSGGTLSILDRGADEDAAALVAQIGRDAISVIHVVPSTLSRLVNHLERNRQELSRLATLRFVVCGGDVLFERTVERFAELMRSVGLDVRVIHTWGTPATGIGAACFEWRPSQREPARLARGVVPIGTPAADLQLEVLQPGGEPAPVGVPGELHASNAHLALRRHRTGELARWLPTGALELVGRVDDAELTRDRRIDLRFIESQIRRLPAVHEAVVVYRTDGDKVGLVAYVVPSEASALDPAAINAELRATLTDYMLPAAYVVLERLPLTAHGRVDKNALPSPEERHRANGHRYVAPRTEVEIALAGILREVLQLTQVGLRDDFFELGGHSVRAIQLVSSIRKHLKVEVPITLIFEAPGLEAMASRIERVLAEGGGARPAAIAAVARDGAIPLAYAQERVWFVHEHMADQRTSYNITSALHFHGKRFSLERLRAAFEGLVARHETLRTQFQVVEGGVEPQQVIGPPRTVEIARVEVSEAEVTAAVNELSRQAFDLEQGPLVKVCVLRVADDRHIVVLNIHHIIADGWSFGVLINELQRLYDGDVRLEPLVVQYAEYAVWQRRQDLSAQLAYWKRRLDGYEDGMDLPYDQPRRAGRAWRAATLQCRYPAELARKVAAFSREQHATLFMSLVASLAVVLSRYTNRRDLCIGTTVAGRDQIELEKLIGFFINILPLRIEVPGEVSLKEVVQRTKQVVLEGFEHQALPFEHLLKELRKPRDTSQIPLVPVMVRHQNFPIAQVESWAEGVALEKFELCGERTTPSEMDWQFFGDGTTLELTLEYAADLFAEDTVRRMVAHHQRVLEALVERPDERVDAVDVLTAEEQQLYARMNDTASSTDTWRSLAERFEAQVEATPEAVACISVVEHGDARRLTYRELNARANAVARRLRAMGVRAETRVAVICERSQELLVAMLATFKAGGCYVPIDPQYPKQYIEEILADAAPEVVLGMGGLEIGDQVEVENPPAVRIEPASLACLMYTSGSTGRPKGVMVPYAQIDNWLQASWRRYPFAAGEVMLQKTSIAFAVSVKELLTGLLAGVAQVMLPDAMVKDSAALAAASERWAVTRMHLVPSHLRALLETVGERTSMLRSLRYIVTAGEALPRAVRDEVRQKLPQVALWNNYGCTELNDTTYFAATAADGPDTAFVPIGQPIANTHVYALDEQLRRVPIGVIGELHVDSVGMARGYWGQPDLTAERFIPNPYSRRPGARLYRTGDMVRVLGDGTLEYIGRRDYEIKVRGHRVDVRQVEAVANAHPAIRQAVVAGWPPGSSAAQLAAYLVPHSAVDIEQIRRYLAEHLPTYMVPTLYTVVEALPRLPNDKLDRQALPAPDVTSSREEYVAPRNAIEQQLADVFGDVLGVTHIGIHDNFFHLGGHSLLASRLISRIRQRFRVELPMALVFEFPEVEFLAQHIELELKDGSRTPLLHGIEQVSRTQPIPLSHLQERLWFVHRYMEEQRTSYNGTIALRLRGPLSIPALRAAFDALVARHELLRTTFTSRNGSDEPVQLIHDSRGLDIPVLQASEADIFKHMDELAGHIYDFVNGPLFIVRILELGDQHHVLVIGMHHIIYDGWSQFNIMSRDIGVFYHAFLTGTKADLPTLPIQYADYSVWQRNQGFNDHITYWKANLSGYRDGLELPYDYPRPPSRTWHAANISFTYPEPLAREFARFTRAHHSTLFMGLLASFSMVLKNFTGRDDICVGTTTAGRNHIELENLIGFFINILPLRLDLSGDPDVAELMRRAKQTVLGAFEHQALPFERLLGVLQKPRDSSQIPLVPVVLRHQNFPTTMSGQWHDGVTMEIIERDERTTPNELDLQFFDDDSGLKVIVEYPTELFSEATIRRMIQHHRRAMEFLVQSMSPNAVPQARSRNPGVMPPVSAATQR